MSLHSRNKLLLHTATIHPEFSLDLLAQQFSISKERVRQILNTKERINSKRSAKIKYAAELIAFCNERQRFKTDIYEKFPQLSKGCINTLLKENCIKTRNALSLTAPPKGWNFSLEVHPLYSVYSNMINRCYNPIHNAYKNYGGRGITVCDRWRGEFGFENWLCDIGPRPHGRTNKMPAFTLERRNNSLGYFSDNCCWATWEEQAKNKRK